MGENSSLPILPADWPVLPPGWEAMFEAIEDGLCVHSLSGQVVRANSAFAAMLGLPLDEIIGHPCSELFSCHKPEDLHSRFCARMESGLSGQLANEDIGGRIPGQRLRSRVSPIRDDSGRITAFVMVVRDITDVTAHERELARVAQLARMGALAAGLAHEIKNPLAGIQGAIDILTQRRHPQDPEREILGAVRRAVSRIDATVQTLLDRTQPLAFNFQPASLTSVVLRAINLACASITPDRQITIELCPEPEPIVMVMDALQIEDAVLNLLLNSVAAITEAGSISVRLFAEPATDKTSGHAVIEISDTGRGIPAENLAQIFSPLFTTSPNGTGLGLPAARRIARAHNGQIEVSSTPGEGSTFSLRLPLKPL